MMPTDSALPIHSSAAGTHLHHVHRCIIAVPTMLIMALNMRGKQLFVTWATMHKLLALQIGWLKLVDLYNLPKSMCQEVQSVELLSLRIAKQDFVVVKLPSARCTRKATREQGQDPYRLYKAVGKTLVLV